MPEGENGSSGAPEGGGSSGTGFQPITSQDELNKLIGDRVARAERKTAEKYADYDALKADADKFRQGQDASKSELDKATDRIGALEQELVKSRDAALRARIQAKFSISDEDAALFLTATDEDTLNKQAERLAGRAADRKKSGNRDPFAGRTTESKKADSPLRDFARDLFGRD